MEHEQQRDRTKNDGELPRAADRGTKGKDAVSHNEHRENSPSAHASVQDRAGLYIGIVALFVAVLALGMVIMIPRLIQAEVDRGIAQAKAEMQEQVAEAKQIANTGREHARIALSEVERANAELAAKGLIRKADH